MLKPISELATESKATLEKESSKLQKTMIDTDKLNNAVFFTKRKTKNIFHVVLDDITEVKSKQIQHEKITTAQLDSFNR